jgi:hypothetical protein
MADACPRQIDGRKLAGRRAGLSASVRREGDADEMKQLQTKILIRGAVRHSGAVQTRHCGLPEADLMRATLSVAAVAHPLGSSDSGSPCGVVGRGG